MNIKKVPSWACYALMLLFLLSACSSPTKQALPSQESEKIVELVKGITQKADFYGMRNMDSAIYFAQLAIDTAEQLGVSKAKGIALFKYSQMLYGMGNLDSAVQVMQQTLPLLEEEIDKSPSYTMLGLYHGEMNQQAKGLKYAQKALSAAKEAQNQVYIAAAYNIIGILYMSQEQIDLAQQYYKKGLEVYRVLGDSIAMATSYLNIGSIPTHAMDLDYLDSALVFSTKMNDILTIASALNNIGSELLNRDQPKEALYYIDSAYTIIKQIGAIHQLPFTINAMSKCYYKLGALEQAKYWSLECLNYQQHGSTTRAAAESHLILARIAAKQQDWEAAYQYRALANEVRDSVYSKERADLIAKMEGKFQLSEKDKALAETERDLAVQEATNSQLWIGGMVLMAVLILLFAVYRLNQYKRTEAAKYQMRLKENERQHWERMHEVKSNFLANISHELRTPLTLLLSPLRALVHHQLEGDREQYLGIMLQNGERLERLIQQLLNLSKLEKDEWPAQYSLVDLWQQLRSISTVFEAQALAKQQQLQLTIPSNTLAVQTDVEKLEQLVSNLLSNAIKYTPEGGEISLSAQQLTNNTWQLIVSDTGKGIPEAALPKLFERFYRVDDAGTQQELGTGLGLALVQELVEWFDGTIEVTSIEGKGSSFICTLPLKPVDAQLLQATSQQTPIDLSIFAGQTPPSILVVEDHPQVRHFLLEQLGAFFQVESASNGLEGLEKAQQVLPDLILTDVMMPKMNGYELCEALKTKKETQHIPVIMLTALGSTEARKKGLEASADYYLNKPVDLQELYLILRNLFLARQQLREHLKEVGVLAVANADLPSMEQLFLENLVDLVETHIDDEAYSIQQLAADMSLSRSQLHRKIVALTNQTPSQFVRMLRLQKAKKMLEDRQATVSEVAYACGFKTPSYFSRCFQEAYGQSPKSVMNESV